MSKVTIQGLKGTVQRAHAVYDFAKDGGAFGAGNEIDLFKLTSGIIVHGFYAEVETALASGGAATVEVGVTGGDTDSVMKQLAYTALGANVLTDDDDKGAALWDDTSKFSKRYKVTSETVLSMLIGTAALTAGKIHFYVDYSAGY